MKKTTRKAGTFSLKRLFAGGPEVRLSIRVKMALYMLAIFLSMLLIMNFFIAQNISQGNERYINDDLVTMKNNGLIYVKQMLVLSQQNNNEEGFAAIAQDLVEEISGATGNPTAAFTMDGQMLAATNSAVFIENNFGDVSLARGGLSAFTLDTESQRTRAYFSYPVLIEGNSIGMIRTVADYTILYTQGNNIMRSVSLITMVICFVSLVIAVLFASSIASPIMKLARISEALQKDVEQNKIDVGKVVRLARSKRRDELGILSRNFAEMIYRIDQQMKTINTDKYELKRLSEYRKVFYDNVTHELKTPLTTIQGYAQLLEQAGAADGELFSRGLAHIQHESARLHRMVIQLLEMSDIDRGGSLEPMDAAAVLRSVAQSMALKAVRYGCAIRFDGEESLPILGREERVRQLCINLIDNAIKYGAPGETIWAVADHSGSRASLRVINRGEGFTDEEAERLFEPFYRVDKEHSREMGSAGLGLSICKKIVEEHGGAIRARSRGGYTVFEVRLPLDKAKWEGGAPA